jgi:hypothetical protein
MWIRQSGETPQGLIVDNGPEFTVRAFLAWAETHEIGIIHTNQAHEEWLYRKLSGEVPE